MITMWTTARHEIQQVGANLQICTYVQIYNHYNGIVKSTFYSYITFNYW
jgi:hypothetical protein